MNTTDLLQTDVTKALGLDDATPEERETILAEVGELILQSALQRLLLTLDETAAGSLAELLSREVEQETILQEVFTEHPELATLLEEEAQAFRDEVRYMLV